MKTPTPKEIKQARLKAGLTQTEAGALVHVALRTWQQWEHGDFKMSCGLWELFNIKTPDESNHVICYVCASSVPHVMKP